MLNRELVETKIALGHWYAKVWTMVKPFVLMLGLGLLMGIVLGFGQLVMGLPVNW